MKLFAYIEASWTSKIQERTNTFQNCSRVDAAQKEDLQCFMFFKVCGPLAKAIRRSQSKELKSFTKPKIGLHINQLMAWRGLERPGVTFPPGIFFFRHGDPPPKTHNQCWICKVPRRTAAVFT